MKKTLLMFLVCCSSYLFGMQGPMTLTDAQSEDVSTIVFVAQRCVEDFRDGVMSDDGTIKKPAKRSLLFCSAESPAARNPESYVLVLLASVAKDSVPKKVEVLGIPCQDPIRSLAIAIATTLEGERCDPVMDGLVRSIPFNREVALCDEVSR